MFFTENSVSPIPGDSDRVNTVTVHVLAMQLYYPTRVCLVFNKEEANAPRIAMYGNTKKPPAWGNGGGGMEPNELELFRKRDPDHPFLTDPRFSDWERMFVGCGLREFKDESGYSANIKLTNQGELVIYWHRYQNGHRRVLLWGEVESLVAEQIAEVDEIEFSDWFDLREPIATQFHGLCGLNEATSRRGFPYWSHVRANVRGIFKRDRETNLEKVGPQIHPSWFTPFPFGKNDSRFPRRGFLIPPYYWYFLIETMIRDKMDMPDLDFIYEKFKWLIDGARLEEECEMAYEERSAAEGLLSDDDSGSARLPVPSRLPNEDDEEVVIDERPSLEGVPRAVVDRDNRAIEDDFLNYKYWMENVLNELGLLSKEAEDA